MNALEIKDLKKSFSGFCLEELSFTLPKGCIMGLVGENGAGKSTTIKLILDMIKRDSGKITVLGRDNIEDIADDPVRIFHTAKGFPRDIENIRDRSQSG